jgi:DNA (cytosine-5)-methyltransferase 1
MKKLEILDMFCGGGGESAGIIQAAQQYDYNVHLTAINHWERAIETHSINFPSAEHFCESVEHLDPVKVVPGQKLDLLWASPECTHHSIARGGRPRDDQSRCSAWIILKWLQELYVERVIIENVPEFLTWGPLDQNGKPEQKSKGLTFRSFIRALRSLGYTVDYHILCAADYGVATTRRRLFIQAVKGRKKILWPEITNFDGTDGQIPLMDVKPWKCAKEIIDWSIPGESIFNRKRLLADATMERIENGIKRFWGKQADPFIMKYYSCGQEIDSIGKPLSTISTNPHHYLVEPFLVKYYGNEKTGSSILRPLDTVTTKERFGLVEGIRTTLDIRFRMLQPQELAAAQGFPGNYRFTGTKTEVVRQIGNAVPPGFAAAIYGKYLKSSGERMIGYGREQ